VVNDGSAHLCPLPVNSAMAAIRVAVLQLPVLPDGRMLAATVLVAALLSAADATVHTRLKLDSDRGVLVVSAAIEAPNIPANVSADVELLKASVAELHCSLCQAHGECVLSVGTSFASCTCRAGWMGRWCDKPICSCLNGGTCILDVHTQEVACMCRHGFSGIHCQSATPVCDTGVCTNGTVCITTIVGLRCVIPVGGCTSAPCINGGQCVESSSEFRCECQRGYKGAQCEQVDECASSPCRNSGACTDGVNAYACTCAAGFTGGACESNVDECASSPCRNGGACTDGVNAYACTCAAGFTGGACESNVDECASSPCRFSATCTPGSPRRKFVCSTFVTRWNTANVGSGSSSSNQIRLPLESDGVYNFVVQWGDGTSSTVTSSSQALRTYSIQGEYTITITGTLRGWRFDDTGDKLKLLDVMQWGTMQLGNNGGYFWGAANMIITATDSPDLSGTTSMVSMFARASKLTGNIGHWDVGRVTNMNHMFHSAALFNAAIGSWDVSQVTNMVYTFTYAAAFNQPIGTWNVSSVTDMFGMFYYASAFNQPIGDWNVARVTDMYGMFEGARVFNQPIGRWRVSQVSDMYRMFFGASAFNQDISKWCVTRIASKPTNFDANTPISWAASSKPVWGTCPSN
jgi:surface protein